MTIDATDESLCETHARRALFFYADESWVEIEGKRHLLLGAIAPEDPRRMTLDVVALKTEAGLQPLDELKWSMGGDTTQAQRVQLSQGVLDILSGQCTGFVSLVEGTDKQHATELLCRQIADYCNEEKVPVFVVYADEGLVPRRLELRQLLGQVGGNARCAGLQSVVSADEQLIQCCDVFAGLYRQVIRHELEGISKPIQVFDESAGEAIEFTVSEYTLVATRFLLWGKCPDPLQPYKNCMGLGLRVHSSLSNTAMSKLERLAVSYLGCMH